MVQVIYTVFHFLCMCLSMFCERKDCGGEGDAGFEFFSGSCLLSVWCWQQDLWPHSHSRLVSMPLSPPHRPVRVFVHFLCVCVFYSSQDPPPSPPAFPLAPCSVSQLALWLAHLSVIKLIITSSDVPVVPLFWFYLLVSVLCFFYVRHVKSAASMLMMSEWFFSQTLRIFNVWKVRRKKCCITVFAETDVFFKWLKRLT